MTRSRMFLLAVARLLFIPVAEAQERTGTETADQAYKNIQVLKGLPANELIPAMQFITASLGVECDYCHVQGASEKDDKKAKLAARKMMTMMFAINKDNFEGHREVTCNTCHSGSPHPMATPALGDGKPAMMAMNEDQAKAPSPPHARPGR